MKKKIIVLIITMLIILPVVVYADYEGVDTDISIGGGSEASKSSEEITGRIVGILQTAGTIISLVALIIIGIRYMVSSVEQKSKMKGVLVYYIIGCVLVFSTSNIVAIAYNVTSDVQHTYGPMYEEEEPTCVREGIAKRKCVGEGGLCRCSESKPHVIIVPTNKPIDPDAHDFNTWTKQSLSCENAEIIVTECKNEGCTYYLETITDATGHNIEYDVVLTHPTCVDAGMRGDRCTNAGCTYKVEKEPISPTGVHNYTVEDTSDTYIKLPATCIRNQVNWKKCATCPGRSDNEDETFILYGTATGVHNFTEMRIESQYYYSAATCKEPAQYYKSCGNEGCTQSSNGYTNDKFYAGVKTNSHGPYEYRVDPTDRNLKSPATCGSDAVYYKICGTCDGIMGETFPLANTATGEHSYTVATVNASYKKSDATCQSPAIYYKSCNECGKCSESDDYTFTDGSALDHQFTLENAEGKYLKSGADCANPAVYYKSCNECGKCSESDDYTFTYGSATGKHVYTAQNTSGDYLATSATCESPAKYYYKCTGCTAKDTTTFDSGSKLGHDYSGAEWNIQTVATCVSGGSKYQKCNRCGKNGASTATSVNPNNHNFNTVYFTWQTRAEHFAFRWCTLCDYCEHSNIVKPCSYKKKGDACETCRL